MMGPRVTKKVRLSHEVWESYSGQTDELLDLEIRTFRDQINEEGYAAVEMKLTFIDTSDEEAGRLEIWNHRREYFRSPWQASDWSEGRSMGQHVLILEAKVVKTETKVEVWPPKDKDEGSTPKNVQTTNRTKENQ